MNKRKFASGDRVRILAKLKSVQDYWRDAPKRAPKGRRDIEQYICLMMARARRNRGLRVYRWFNSLRLYHVRTSRGLNAGLYSARELEHV